MCCGLVGIGGGELGHGILKPQLHVDLKTTLVHLRRQTERGCERFQHNHVSVHTLHQNVFEVMMHEFIVGPLPFGTLAVL